MISKHEMHFGIILCCLLGYILIFLFLFLFFFFKVLQSELYAIQQACTALEKGYQPSITFIVVQKRHHARFFAQNREDTVSFFSLKKSIVNQKINWEPPFPFTAVDVPTFQPRT